MSEEAKTYQKILTLIAMVGQGGTEPNLILVRSVGEAERLLGVGQAGSIATEGLQMAVKG